MHLEELPTEILHAICQDIDAFGSVFGASPLVGLTRVSRRLHAVSNPILYSTDVRASGGFTSMRYGLRTGLKNVVKLCLAAGADPNLRFEARHDLDTHFPSVSRLPSRRPGESNGFSMNVPAPDPRLESGRMADNPSPSEDSGDDIDGDFNTASRIDENAPSRSVKAFYWTPLHVAATQDDIELLSLLLDHGANPNSAGRGVCICHRVPLRRTFGRSIPFYEESNLDLLESKILTRWSSLHVAVCKGSLDCAEELVRRFGLPHATESDETVLAEARRTSRYDLPVLEADFDTVDFDTLTPRFDPLPPLHVAADRYSSVEDLERVYSMLDKAGCLEGPNSGVDILDAFGDTPFSVAVFSGRIQILGNWFHDHGSDINFALHLDGLRYSVFNALCKSGLFKDALLLMDFGIDINRDTEMHLGNRHESALHWCCGYGEYKSGRPTIGVLRRTGALVLIKRLIHAGANVDARTGDGITGLMLAAKLGFTEAVRELLKAKADVGAEDDNGDCALCHAVAYGLSLDAGPELDGALFIIQLLLDNGADPNQRSESRGPPLFTGRYDFRGSFANYFGSHDISLASFDGPRSSMVYIAPLLINNGADPNIYLKDPRHTEEGNFYEQLEKLGGRSLVVSAFYFKEFESLKSLVASGTVVTVQDYLLMMRSFIDPRIPSSGSRAAAVEILFRVLNYPSVISERPEGRRRIMDAWTEVLYLAVGSRPRLVHALAPHICLTDMCGPGGKTVLHLMAQWERKRNERPDQFEERISQMMINLFRCGAGRQIDQPDHSGRSPLHLAVDRGNIAVTRQLLGFGASLHIEYRMPNGSTAISPLRSAIRSYSKASQFKVVIDILEFSIGSYEWTDRLPGNLGLLQDLILHFGGYPFDEPARMASRTTEIMGKLFAIGVSVNESDEHGNTALHHLIQLLYPSNESSKDSGDHEGFHSSQPASFTLSSFVGAGFRAGTDPGRFFKLSEKRDGHLNGHNLIYESDSDYDSHPDNEDQPVYDIFDDSDSDISDDIGYAETAPPNELGELVNHDPQMASGRCHTWLSSFLFLLVNGASLTMRNNAGKTVLDYIDELIGCQPPACPKTYSPVIPALRESVKRPPFDPELLAKLKHRDMKVRGRPLLIVHDLIHLFMNKDGIETAHFVEHRAAGQGKTHWSPFW